MRRQAPDDPKRKVALGDLLDASEVAEMCGWATRYTVHVKLQRGTFVPPCKIWPRKVVWARADVERWLAENGHNP